MNKILAKEAHHYAYYGIIALVCFFSFFIHNRVIPADLMESRNLATAQEMVQYGNYLLPTLNGDLRLEKPPLPTWVAAGIEHVVPGNLPAQRCAAGAMAFAMALFLYLLVSRLTRSRNAGLIAALILATCINVVLAGRTASWDIYAHSFMLGAICLLIVALEGKGAQGWAFAGSGALMGLSFLSKGPVAHYALLLPFLASYAMVYRPSLKGKLLPLAGGILLCLAVSGGWYLYTYLFHEDLLLGVVRQESAAWLNHNVRPWYYYWQFPAEAGIWALFWLTSLVYFLVRKEVGQRKEYMFAVVWFLGSLLLLSAIPEKKTRYLLPLLIPGAMMTGLYLHQMITGIKFRAERVVFRINAGVVAGVVAALPVAFYFLFYPAGQISPGLLGAIAVASWGLAGWIGVSAFGKKKGIQAENVFRATVLSMVMATALCLVPIGKLFINDERHSIRLLRENAEVAGLPFFTDTSEQPLRMELVYEAGRRIRGLDLSDREAVEKAAPFVLVSESPADSLLAGQPVTVETLGTFDNNWRKPGHKRYNPDLVKEAAIIRKKQPEHE